MSKLAHPLTQGDRERVCRHFLKLGSEDRRLRFGTALENAAIEAYCAQLNFEQSALFGVFGPGLELDGVAHLALWPGAAEVGLSVLEHARGDGIGSLLFARAALHARNSGVSELFMHCLRENAPIRRIAERAGMRIIVDSGEADAFMELPLPTPFTVGQELYENQCALVDWTLMSQVAQPDAEPLRRLANTGKFAVLTA